MRLFKLLAVLLAVLCFTGRTFAGEQLPVPVLRIDQAPVLDGRLDEPFWSDAEPQSGFTAFRGDDKIRDDTTFRLAYDDVWLYIGLECKNPLQSLIFAPNVTEHDGAINRDEAVEIFLDPGTDGKLYFHFLLSCFNIKAEQKVVTTPNFNHDRGWDHPWRSAVQRHENGWTAEVALPLYLVASYGDFERMRLNVSRTHREPSMDAQMVITHEDIFYTIWRPVKLSFHEPDSFALLAPLHPEKLSVPFLPFLERSEIGGAYLSDGSQFFDVTVEVRNETVTPGGLELVVDDQPVSGEGTIVREQIALDGRDMRTLTVPVPMKSIADRVVEVRLLDADTGEEWGRRMVQNPAALNVLQVYLDRNYYTDEQQAVLVAEIGLPVESLRELDILVLDSEGRELARGTDVVPETHIAFPLDTLAIGTHTLSMELRSKSSSADTPAMLSEDIELVRRAPKPGLEWKIDQINRVLLKPDGTPFFPFGPVMGGCKAKPQYADAFRDVAEAGFNTFVQWHRYLAPEDVAPYIEMTSEHGLYFITKLETGWSSYRDAGLELPEKYMNAKEAGELLNMWHSGSVFLRCFLMKVQSANYAQRTEIFNEYYFKNVDRAERLIRTIMNAENLIAYNTFDEALAMPWFDVSQALNHLRELTHKIDGYHPVMFVSAGEVPEDRVYEDATDVFIPDPYWAPSGGRRGRDFVNSVSRRMHLSDERCARSRKVLWAMPVAWVYSGIFNYSKRPISAEEQDCQNFLAIIHGARGLFWFTWPMHAIGWENLVDSAAKVKVIGEMAVQPRVAQVVSYERILADGERAPAPFDVANDVYPDVQASVFRDPQGGLVLVAANSSYYPVRTEFKVAGLDSDVRRVFADTVLEVRDEMFSEDIEPMGVRAYRLGELAEPCSVVVASERTGDISPLAQSAIVNKTRPDRKNVLPNPAFEQESIPGLPDYYIALEDGMTIERNPDIAKFGRQCVRLQAEGVFYSLPDGRDRIRWVQRGRFFMRSAPQVATPTPHVFSVWLRGEKGGEKVELQLGSKRETVTITDEWQRYTVPVVIRPELTLRRHLAIIVRIVPDRQQPRAVCWVDGIQLEAGDEATDFED